MQGNEVHLSDEDLLLFSDQELPPSRAATVREHVAQCELCRQRLRDLEHASADFLDLHEQEIQARSSGLGTSRDLLKARLSEESAQARRSRSVTSVAQQLVSASLAFLLVVGGAWAIRHIGGERSSSDNRTAESIALPRRALTPGSIQVVRVEALCSNQSPDNDPPVNPSLEQAVFKEYGVPASSKKDYELDYLITPALGGADNIQNLWPEPYSFTWNARVKDQLEDHLHTLVCQGKIQLATAQNDIASDWIAAYKRYFNTDKPEPTQSPASQIVHPKHELKPSQRGQREYRISTIYVRASRSRESQISSANPAVGLCGIHLNDIELR
jgi:hypothetical protein